MTIVIPNMLIMGAILGLVFTVYYMEMFDAEPTNDEKKRLEERYWTMQREMERLNKEQEDLLARMRQIVKQYQTVFKDEVQTGHSGRINS